MNRPQYIIQFTTKLEFKLQEEIRFLFMLVFPFVLSFQFHKLFNIDLSKVVV